MLGEVHGSAVGSDLRVAEPAEREELCAHCEAADKYPGFGVLSGNGQKVKKSCPQRPGFAALWSPRTHRLPLLARLTAFRALSRWSIAMFAFARAENVQFAFYVTWDICAKRHFCSGTPLRRFTQTPLHTVVNPAALECPQRVALISIFIEMLSKPLRATRSNRCCLGSVLHRQVSALLLLLFVFMPLALIPLKGRWWSHTSVIPVSEERFGSDCMLTEYINPSMCFNWQSIYFEQEKAEQEHSKELLTLCCTEGAVQHFFTLFTTI